MPVAIEKVFLLCTMILVFYNNVSTVEDGPFFSLPNGKVLPSLAEVIAKNGASLKLFCTGKVEDIVVFCDGYGRLPMTIVNQTTVRVFQEKLSQPIYKYYCIDTKKHTHKYLKVLVEPSPMVTKLLCISENLEYINCTWTSPNYKINSSLYYVKDGDPFRLCNLNDVELRYDEIPYCVWDRKHPAIPYEFTEDALTFLMTTCTLFECTNQTFVINHHAILKFRAPRIVKLLNVTSHWAVLKLTENLRFPYQVMMSKLPRILTFEYKIICVYSGFYQCELFKKGSEMINNYGGMKLELKLPCAETLYEVRISMKYTEAIGEEYWSENAISTFVTDSEPENVGAAVDPSCKKQRVKITREVMFYELDKFRSEVMEEQKALKDSIRALKLKVDKITHPLDIA